MKRCPICAEMVDDHLSVCPYCGEPLPGGTPSDKPQPEPSQPETPQTDTPSSDAADSSSGEMRFCPVCGEHIGAHLAICPVCFEPTGFDSTPIHEVAASGPVVEEHPSPEPPQPEVSPESTTIHKTERKLVFGPEPEPEHQPEPEPMSFARF